MLGSRSFPWAMEDANRRPGAANGRLRAANARDVRPRPGPARLACARALQSRSAGACAGSAPPVMGGVPAGCTAGCSPGFLSRTR